MEWRKTNIQLPPSLDFADVHYRLDGKRSDGIIIEIINGEFVYEWREQGVYHQIADLSRVEWLDEDTKDAEGEGKFNLDQMRDAFIAGRELTDEAKADPNSIRTLPYNYKYLFFDRYQTNNL